MKYQIKQISVQPSRLSSQKLINETFRWAAAALLAGSLRSPVSSRPNDFKALISLKYFTLPSEIRLKLNGANLVAPQNAIPSCPSL